MAHVVNDEHKFPKRIREWLRDSLDGRNIEGLEWMDKKKCLFKIRWEKKDEPGWIISENIFKLWAINKDQEYKKQKFSQLKGRFRDALRNSNHLKEITDLHVLTQQTGNYRVYMFLTRNEVEAKKRGNRSTTQANNTTPTTSPSQDSFDSSHFSHTPASNEDLLSEDSLQKALEFSLSPQSSQTIEGVLNDDCNDLLSAAMETLDLPTNSNVLLDMINDGMDLQMSDNVIADTLTADVEQVKKSVLAAEQTLPKFQSTEELLAEFGIEKTELSKFKVTLRYGKEVIGNSTVVDFSRCLRFQPDNASDSLATGITNHHPIIMPPYNGTNRYIKKILEHMADGVALVTDNGYNLYGKRLCRSHIYYINSELPEEKCIKMETEKEVLLFSYLNYLENLFGYLSKERESRPECEVMMVFGSLPTSPLSKTLVSLNIEPVAAEKLRKIVNPSESFSSLLVSGEDSLNAIRQNLDELRNSHQPANFDEWMQPN